MKDTQIIMLGTGNAGVTRCYNTCFAIRTAENVLLVDAIFQILYNFLR